MGGTGCPEPATIPFLLPSASTPPAFIAPSAPRPRPSLPLKVPLLEAAPPPLPAARVPWRYPAPPLRPAPRLSPTPSRADSVMSGASFAWRRADSGTHGWRRCAAPALDLAIEEISAVESIPSPMRRRLDWDIAAAAAADPPPPLYPGVEPPPAADPPPPLCPGVEPPPAGDLLAPGPSPDNPLLPLSRLLARSPRAILACCSLSCASLARRCLRAAPTAPLENTSTSSVLCAARDTWGAKAIIAPLFDLGDDDIVPWAGDPEAKAGMGPLWIRLF